MARKRSAKLTDPPAAEASYVAERTNADPSFLGRLNRQRAAAAAAEAARVAARQREQKRRSAARKADRKAFKRREKAYAEALAAKRG